MPDSMLHLEITARVKVQREQKHTPSKKLYEIQSLGSNQAKMRNASVIGRLFHTGSHITGS